MYICIFKIVKSADAAYIYIFSIFILILCSAEELVNISTVVPSSGNAATMQLCIKLVILGIYIYICKILV